MYDFFSPEQIHARNIPLGILMSVVTFWNHRKIKRSAMATFYLEIIDFSSGQLHVKLQDTREL